MSILATSATAIGAVSNLVSTIKTVAGAAKTATKQELQKQVEDLANQAGDVAIKVMELQNQNLQLAQENAELKQQSKEQHEFEWRDNAMWRKNADGSPDGPYCAACYHSKKKVIHLHKDGTHNRCPVCEEYQIPIRAVPQVITLGSRGHDPRF